MSINPVNTMITPVISEKSLAVARDQNAYTFQVGASINKYQIAQAVELQFDVHVIQVKIVKHGGKLVRTGKRRATKHVGGKKKAVVYLKKGESIKLFEVS